MAEKKIWKIDPAHSQVHFLPYHMGINFIPGRFNKYDGELKTSGEDFTDLEAELKIDVKSLSTGNDDRDKHLRSDEFFNSEKYPEITFKGKSSEGSGDNFKVKGDLTIRDKTQEVTMDVTHRGTITDPYGKRRAGFSIACKVNRFDFDINWNEKYNRGPVVDPEVKLGCDIEVVNED